MCGIAGFVGEGGRGELEAMTTALAHRGPDGAGFFVDQAAAVHLGHRRLAIIDIAGGRQPMANADGTIQEIYNFRELRAELAASGHVFKSDHSDTEVLVHGWTEWGENLPIRLNGMFAFAIYDALKRRIFLARDRFGEKPLYYVHRTGFFAFASELSALGRHGLVDRSINPLALQKFFAWGFIPAPSALWSGARKLPAGHAAMFALATGELNCRAYWQFRIEPDEELAAKGEAALAEELRSLLAAAVRRRLVSDVPLGIFLSGGIDSSSILAFARQADTGGNLKTFTIGFDDPSFDESAAAHEMANFAASTHAEERLDVAAMCRIMPEVLPRLDEPLGDPSILPTFLLARFARQQVTVALSGDGGDELFAGYDPFKALTPARLYSRLVGRGLHRGVRRLADILPISTRNMSLDLKLRRTLRGLSYPQKLWNPIWLAPIDPQEIGELFASPVRADDLYSEALDLWENAGSTNIVDRTLEFFTRFYLQDDILTKVDRATMMVSLESRAIFLDNDVAEFCRHLPHRFKYRRGVRKYLLKKALAGVVPEPVLSRRKKGFGVPIGVWLKKVPAEVPMQPLPGLDMSWASLKWREHRDGRADHRQFLWSWLSLQAVYSVSITVAQPGIRPQIA